MSQTEHLKIVVTGGTGFIGKALIPALVLRGHRVTLLVRKEIQVNRQFPAMPASAVRTVLWDGGGNPADSSADWRREIDGADAVIHLAGEPIGARRWSDSQKLRIEKSRTEATRAIVDAIAAADAKPHVLISGSAVGYYGPVRDGDVRENHPPGSDFLSSVCIAWEREALRAEDTGVRTVQLRTGIVLEQDGGALQKLLLPFKLYGGGPLGTGKQWMSWIHRDDVVRIIQFALENDALHGPINATAPHPVTMNAFASTLARVMHRPSWAHVPEFVLKAILGEMSTLVLDGQCAVPMKLIDAGYTFTYETLEPSLQNILQS